MKYHNLVLFISVIINGCYSFWINFNFWLQFSLKYIINKI